jgi:hypothetical protein
VGSSPVAGDLRFVLQDAFVDGAQLLDAEIAKGNALAPAGHREGGEGHQGVGDQPVVEAAGFDLIWFGIYLVVMIELAQVTPPVGFNLFVISGLNNDDLFTIAKAAFPFFLLMLLATVLLTVFPEIALYLPGKMK